MESGSQHTDCVALVQRPRYNVQRFYRFTDGEIRFDDEMRGLFALVKGPNGRPLTRDFARAAWGEVVPWRSLARYVVRAARAAGANAQAVEAQMLAIVARFEAFVRETFTKCTRRGPGKVDQPEGGV